MKNTDRRFRRFRAKALRRMREQREIIRAQRWGALEAHDKLRQASTTINQALVAAAREF